jgi:hypothetical protein
MKLLNDIQTQQLMKRIPPFELSYETIAHKKVFPNYNIALAIPNGKKYCAWFSFEKENDVCYLMDYSRNQKINKINIVQTTEFKRELCIGTILYGTLVTIGENVQTQFFIIEDIFHYKGISLKSMLLSEKLGYIEKVLEHMSYNQRADHNPEFPTVVFALPFMWGLKSTNEQNIISEYEKHKENIIYNSHHIQLRKLNEISPYINIPLNNILSKIGRDKPIPIVHQLAQPSVEIPRRPLALAFNKPQYKEMTVFQVMADIQYDIYHLYAFGKNNSQVYYGIAGIPTIKSSIYMNNLFRNIRENKNLDYIEESDDEDDFENIEHDKYVDLNKKVIMQCVFHNKFKKWVPVHVCPPHTRIVHISKLVNNYM